MKKELVGSHSETPPVDLPRIPFAPDDLRRHIGHTASDTSMLPALGIVDSDIEVSEMSVASRVEQNVVGFDIPAGGVTHTIPRQESRTHLWTIFRL